MKWRFTAGLRKETKKRLYGRSLAVSVKFKTGGYLLFTLA